MPRTALIAGSGPAALEAALALRALAGPHLHVEMLTPDAAYVHRPVSVLEPFAAGRARRYDLDRLGAYGVRVRKGALALVDAGARRVRTVDGAELPYDALLVATGAQAHPALVRATTFGGRADDVARVHGIVQDVEAGWTRRVAFVAPPGCGWTLPLYELALQTALRAADQCQTVELTVLTAEAAPLEVFGPTGSAAVAASLAAADVHVITGIAEPAPRADRVIALPVLGGHAIEGLPADVRGFLPVDAHGRVEGVAGVYAAGDGTDRPIKQGGLATQQAEAAAEAIALDLGLRAGATPFAGVLRAMLLGGPSPLYLRRHLDQPDGEVSTRCLWWPPSKIAGWRLAPFIDALDAEDGVESAERTADLRAVRRRVAVLGR